jgi:hypothetical protein
MWRRGGGNHWCGFIIDSRAGRKSEALGKADMGRTLRWAGALVALGIFPALALGQGPPVASGAAEPSVAPAPQGASAPTPADTARPQSQSSAPAANPSGNSKQHKKKKKHAATARPANPSSGTQQTNRMLWIVPNFAAVSPGVKFTPMTPKQKFWMATEDSFDYSSFVWTAVLTFQSYELNEYPELGSGGVAYGRYYWRGMVDGISNSYFSEAIVPVLTHEDARYFTLGHGGVFKRLGYALTRVVATYDDSGHNTFNCGEVCGDFASAALSTAYYPPQERGIVKISEGWGTQLESAALNNIAKEFWPDIRKYVFHKQ